VSVLYNDSERYNVVGANVFAQVVFMCHAGRLCLSLIVYVCVFFLLSYDDN